MNTEATGSDGSNSEMTWNVERLGTSVAPIDDGLLHRTYTAEFSEPIGRTVDVRIVPYGETAIAIDGYGGVARGIPYEEEWMPGVFDHQLNAPNRVLANIEHEPGIRGIVGQGTALREGSDGFYGSFKFHENNDGDKALMLVGDKVFEGVSLEAAPRKGGSIRTSSGLVKRVKANLRGIAFCRDAAFKSAKVLALREEAFIDEELLAKPMDPELVERCERLGIRLPQAHPADTGTLA